jgi:hypothetical protein
VTTIERKSRWLDVTSGQIVSVMERLYSGSFHESGSRASRSPVVPVPAVPAPPFLSGGCGGTTTAPSSARTTETFTGTLGAGGKDSHTFTVHRAGQVDADLTSVGPPSMKYVGLAIGLPNGSDCIIDVGAGALFNTVQAGPTPQLTSDWTPGTLCVSIYDTTYDPIVASVNYTVTVTHP